MPKLTSQQKKKRLRNKADKIYQQIGRMLYEDKGCIIPDCKEPYSCLHHWHPKSSCSALRYNLKNGVNLCAKHHLSIHSKHCQSVITKVLGVKGLEWAEELEAIKRNTFTKTTIEYYETIIRNLSKLYDIND